MKKKKLRCKESVVTILSYLGLNLPKRIKRLQDRRVLKEMSN
jgi:hypothetical protein